MAGARRVPWVLAVLLSLLAACGTGGGEAGGESTDDATGDGAEGSPAAEGGGETAEGDVITLVFAAGIADVPVTDVMPAFEEEVEAASDGRIDVELHTGSALGTIEEIVEQVRAGSIHMTVSALAYLAGDVPEIQALTLPYLFDSYETADSVFDGELGDEAEALVEEQSPFTILAWEEFGFKHVVNSRGPINSLEDMAGLKLRVADAPLPIRTFEALGASPVGMPFAETYTAIETGVIDGVEIPYTAIYGFGTHEVADYISATNHFYEPAIAFGNLEFFESLPDDLRAVVDEAAANMAVEARRIQRDGEQEAIANLEAEGASVNTLTDDALAEFAAAVQPVYDWARGEFGEEWVDRVLDAAGASRG